MTTYSVQRLMNNRTCLRAAVLKSPLRLFQHLRGTWIVSPCRALLPPTSPTSTSPTHSFDFCFRCLLQTQGQGAQVQFHFMKFCSRMIIKRKSWKHNGWCYVKDCQGLNSRKAKRLQRGVGNECGSPCLGHVILRAKVNSLHPPPLPSITSSRYFITRANPITFPELDKLNVNLLHAFPIK